MFGKDVEGVVSLVNATELQDRGLQRFGQSQSLCTRQKVRISFVCGCAM